MSFIPSNALTPYFISAVATVTSLLLINDQTVSCPECVLLVFIQAE